jgi:hypothetical protein
MKTRTKSSAKIVPQSESQIAPKSALGADSSNPPQLFILPDDISKDARIVSLTNPRYQSNSRYIICPERGIYEFTKIAPPKTTPRSWLLSPSGNTQLDTSNETKARSYITKAADLFIATPVDPVFFLLPTLARKYKNAEPTKSMFLSSDDYFEKINDASSHFSEFLPREDFRKTLELRLAVICDTVEAGDEVMYRISEEKLLGELLRKANKMIRRGLPASMEEKLVRKALEVPMLSIRREDGSMHELAIEEEENGPSDSAETTDSQTTIFSINSSSTSFSAASIAATSISEEISTQATQQKLTSTLPSLDAPKGVLELLRLRTAFLFICSNYIPPHLSSGLKQALASPASPVNFSPLDAHLAHLAKLRQDALAARSVGDYSRKRAMEEDYETLEIRAEKKRKKDDEEKRKKTGVSVGLKKLQKANTTGMKKMSDFFKKT